jgi:hypothetical protein
VASLNELQKRPFGPPLRPLVLSAFLLFVANPAIAAISIVPEPVTGDSLDLEGNRIEIHRFRGGECANAAALFVPELGALLTGAIVFECSHLFLRKHDIPGWRAHLD